MSDENSTSIDPRFDPAFQRGFDGAISTTRRRPTIGTPPVLPAQQQGVARTVVAAPEAPVAVPPAAAAVAPEPVEETVEQTGGVNPFVVVLWVVAAVLVVGGGYVLQWARTTFLTGSLTTDIDYVTIEIVKYGAPLLVVLGLATAIGLVFLHAIAWRRRH